MDLQPFDEPVREAALLDDRPVSTALPGEGVDRREELVDERRPGRDGGPTDDVAGLVEQDDRDLRLVQVDSKM